MPEPRTLAAAIHIAGLLEQRGVRCALIGAGALAVHGYARATEDLDVGVVVEPFATPPTLRSELMRALHCEADLALPDHADPLGGVLTLISDAFDPIQIVNFHNPLSAAENPGADAVASASALPELAPLCVVDLPHLIALKLYAGGRKSELDVLELLERNQGLELTQVRAVCERYSLTEALDRVLRG